MRAAVISILIAVSIVVSPVAQESLADGARRRAFDQLLDLYVRNGDVYYRALKTERAKLDGHITLLATASVPSSAMRPPTKHVVSYIESANASPASPHTMIVPFCPIDPEMAEHIFEIQVKGLHQLMAGQNIELNITPAAAKHIAKMGFSPDFGARPLAGVIRGQLRRPLSRMIISGELTPGSKITLGLGAGQRRADR